MPSLSRIGGSWKRRGKWLRDGCATACHCGCLKRADGAVIAVVWTRLAVGRKRLSAGSSGVT